MSLLRPVWQLFKVSVNYRHEMMTFLVQRGALAENRQQALALVLESLKLDKAIEWRALIEQTWDPDAFDRDALMLTCLNSSASVAEVIRLRAKT